jgi:dTDP-4-dehydrorhamnose 3,5-epimerase
MRFVPTPLPGLVILEQERHADARGYFARTWCKDELAAHGLVNEIAQSSVSFNARRGTLRGMHWQAPPFAEVKIVRCARGALFDVGVDLRPDSPTFRRWFGVELTPDNGRGLYLPRGFGHGFLTLADATEVHYEISTPFKPETARGMRYGDPFIAIGWPSAPEVISDRDRDYPNVTAAAFEELRGLT